MHLKQQVIHRTEAGPFTDLSFNLATPSIFLNPALPNHELRASLVAQMVKNLPTGDLGLIPELGRFP